MRRRWKLAAAGCLVVAVLWGLGLPGHATPGGPDAPAAVAARAKAAALKAQKAELKVQKAEEKAAKATRKAALAGGRAALSLQPPGSPTRTLTFSGTKLDTKVWGTCYPKMHFAVPGCTNFATGETQWYLPSQDTVSDGELKLTATRMKTPGRTANHTPAEYGCRSGIVTTYPGLHFEYGFLQVVAKIPHGRGLWPALWLAATDGQWPPEMDMIEDWGPPDTFSKAFFHFETPSGPTKAQSPVLPESLTTGWQTYSLSWTSSEMRFYIGTEEVMDITEDVPHQSMYFVANVAAYEPPQAGTCSGTMDIYSVKYWKN